jgi:hypothetical protein
MEACDIVWNESNIDEIFKKFIKHYNVFCLLKDA